MIINMSTTAEIAAYVPVAWTYFGRALSLAMQNTGLGNSGTGRLGINLRRTPWGHSARPAHTHLRID